MVGIYKITSPSGKIYIGKTTNVKERIRKYKYCWCKSQTILYASLKKYGWSAHIFEVIKELPDDTDHVSLSEWEMYYYDKYKNSRVEMMNVWSPDVWRKSGPRDAKNVSKETRAKLSAGNKGRVFSKEWCENISKSKLGKSHKGKPHTEETKKKISHKKKGMKAGKDNPFYGKKHSEEVLSKISKTYFKKGQTPLNKGDIHTEDAKLKMRLGQRRRRYGDPIISYSFGHIN